MHKKMEKRQETENRKNSKDQDVDENFLSMIVVKFSSLLSLKYRRTDSFSSFLLGALWLERVKEDCLWDKLAIFGRHFNSLYESSGEKCEMTQLFCMRTGVHLEDSKMSKIDTLLLWTEIHGTTPSFLAKSFSRSWVLYQQKKNAKSWIEVWFRWAEKERGCTKYNLGEEKLAEFSG